MTNEEAVARIKDHKAIHKMDEPRAIYISEALDMAIEALEILEFAKRNLQFAVEHTKGETKDHYQRALNLLNRENKQ